MQAALLFDSVGDESLPDFVKIDIAIPVNAFARKGEWMWCAELWQARRIAHPSLSFTVIRAFEKPFIPWFLLLVRARERWHVLRDQGRGRLNQIRGPYGKHASLATLVLTASQSVRHTSVVLGSGGPATVC